MKPHSSVLVVQLEPSFPCPYRLRAGDLEIDSLSRGSSRKSHRR